MKRNTLQRQIILDTLKKMDFHPSASQVYEQVHLQYPSISKATVFRILNQELDEGAVMRVMMQGDEMRYEMKTNPHYHMRCKRCGKIEDAPMAYQSRLEDLLGDLHGFQVEGHMVEFYGICEKCRNSNKEEE